MTPGLHCVRHGAGVAAPAQVQHLHGGARQWRRTLPASAEDAVAVKGAVVIDGMRSTSL